MKKLIVILSLGLVLCCMTACGNREGQGATGTTQSTKPQESSTIPVQTETAPAEGAQETGTGEVQEGWSAEMQAVKDAIVAQLGDNYWPNTAITPDLLESFVGITSDMYDDYLAESPMISTNVDTLLIIKAKDGKVEAVQEAVNAYRESKVNDTMQYPMNVGKIQASRIETFGNYVCFVQLGADTSSLRDSGDEAVITYCQEQNELALEIIHQNLPAE